MKLDCVVGWPISSGGGGAVDYRCALIIKQLVTASGFGDISSVLWQPLLAYHQFSMFKEHGPLVKRPDIWIGPNSSYLRSFRGISRCGD